MFPEKLYHPKSVATLRMHLLILMVYAGVLFIFNYFMVDFNGVQLDVSKFTIFGAMPLFLVRVFSGYILVGGATWFYNLVIKNRIYIPVGWGWLIFLIVSNYFQAYQSYLDGHLH